MRHQKRSIISLATLLLLVLSELDCAASDEESTARKVNIGVIVDYDRYGGKMGLRCIEMALSDLYSQSHHKTRLIIHARDSKFDVVGAASAALDLIQSEDVEAIIGPLSSTQAGFVVDLGEKAQVPIVTFSASSSSLKLRSSYFFQATQIQTVQARAISSLVQAFRWRQVVAIYVDNEYGQGLIPSLANAMQDVGARLSHRIVVPAHASDTWIVKELYKLMTMQTRVFVVHTDIPLGQRIFIHGKEIGMMGRGYVWIATNVISNSLSSFNSSIMDSMQGVLGIKTYVQPTKAVGEFRDRWKKQNESDELNVYGLWAYDAATALAIAVEEASKSMDFSFDRKNRRENSDGNSSTDLEALGVSQNGLSIKKALLDVKFKGLAGNFSLVNGHLPCSTFEIVNVDGDNKEQRVGFWTPNTNTTWDIASNPNLLGQIIWPGKSTSVPKGWETPTNRKKLRIGVPEKYGFEGFVEVNYDSVTNNTIVNGFCIDVFKAVVEKLPYSVDYEFIPYKISDGTSNRNYDELVRQVYLEKFDAVVGDITIRASRTEYVDFTLPYTESGVSMVVPLRDDQKKGSAWIFLKPLTWDLWVTSACFFVFIGFAVWALEHRINEEFRGPPSHEIGTSFWFSFSTMVFAHREKVISNSARFVVIIWVYVVLILTQSYTASLTSLLTVQKLRPTVTDVNQLTAKRENVGYIEGSFVRGILIDLGFLESQLKIYRTPEECEELFSRSKSEGGIVAAFDEIPYMKCLLKKYCNKYTMVEPTFKTAGFGFVFPRGSPLVADISRAILTVAEGETMKQIENKWFERQSTCPDPNTQVSSESLHVESFGGLFLIAAVASLSALTVHLLMFLYGQRHVLLHSDARVSALERARIVLRSFDRKDSKAYAVKKSRVKAVVSDLGSPRVEESALTFSVEDQEMDLISVCTTTTHIEASSVAEIRDENREDLSRTP